MSLSPCRMMSAITNISSRLHQPIRQKKNRKLIKREGFLLLRQSHQNRILQTKPCSEGRDDSTIYADEIGRKDESPPSRRWRKYLLDDLTTSPLSTQRRIEPATHHYGSVVAAYRYQKLINRPSITLNPASTNVRNVRSATCLYTSIKHRPISLAKNNNYLWAFYSQSEDIILLLSGWNSNSARSTINLLSGYRRSTAIATEGEREDLHQNVCTLSILDSPSSWVL